MSQPGSCCLSCFCLGWSIQGCAENPSVSRRMATQVHCLASGSLHQPCSPTSSPCGDTPSWSHGPVIVMCPLSFGTHTYWHDVPTPVLGAGYWGAATCVTWGGKHRGYPRHSGELPGRPRIFPNWRDEPGDSQGLFLVWNGVTPCLLLLTWPKPSLNNSVFGSPTKIWVLSELCPTIPKIWKFEPKPGRFVR